MDYIAVYGFKNGGILLMGTIWLSRPVAYGLCCIHNLVSQEHTVRITTDAASLEKLDGGAARNGARNRGPAGTRQGEDILSSSSLGVSAGEEEHVGSVSVRKRNTHAVLSFAFSCLQQTRFLPMGPAVESEP